MLTLLAALGILHSIHTTGAVMYCNSCGNRPLRLFHLGMPFPRGMEWMCDKAALDLSKRELAGRELRLTLGEHFKGSLPVLPAPETVFEPLLKTALHRLRLQ